MLKSKHDQLHCFIQIHEEPGHVRIRDGDRQTCLNLINEQRNDAAPAAHDIAIASAADGGTSAFCCHTSVGVNHMLHHGLGDAHGVDGIGGLVGRQADHPLDSCVNGGMQHVVRADDVGLHRLHGEELTARHLLECRRMENIIHPRHGVLNGLGIPHIANVELDLLGMLRMLLLELVPHVVLLLLIPGEDADLLQVGGKKVFENGRAERARAAGNHEGGVGEWGHRMLSFTLSQSCPSGHLFLHQKKLIPVCAFSAFLQVAVA